MKQLRRRRQASVACVAAVAALALAPACSSGAREQVDAGAPNHAESTDTSGSALDLPTTQLVEPPDDGSLEIDADPREICPDGNFGATAAFGPGTLAPSVEDALVALIARQYPSGPRVEDVRPVGESSAGANGWFFDDSDPGGSAIAAFIEDGAVVYQARFTRIDGGFGLEGEMLCASAIDTFAPELADQYEPK